MIISLANWDRYTDLERSYYEKNAYEDLLGYMSLNKIPDTHNYFERYLEVNKLYTQLKLYLEMEVIKPNTKNPVIFWEVNFNEQYVAVQEAADGDIS